MKWIATALVRCTPWLLSIVAAGGVSSAFTGERGGWAIADFDGDNRPDVAIVNPARGNAYRLRIQLSTASEKHIALPALPASPFGFHLTPRDLDGDRDLDIVVTAGILREPIAVWINDGQGGFSEGDLASYPAPTGKETFLVPPDGPQERAHELFVPSRRSSWEIIPSGYLLSTDECTAILRRGQSKLLIAASPADQHGARAPPAGLSFLS